MSMPHLMNCEHNGDGWCINCVRNLYESFEKQHDVNKTLEAELKNEKKKVVDLTKEIELLHQIYSFPD